MHSDQTPEGSFGPPEPREPAARELSELLDSYDSAVWLAGRKMATEGDSARLKELRSKILAYSAELRAELDKAVSGRKHTRDWYARHYGKLQDWARTRLPEPFVDEFFSCIANGTWHYSDSHYFKLDTAQEQILHDQSTRAEAAERSLLQAWLILDDPERKVEYGTPEYFLIQRLRAALASTSAPEGTILPGNTEKV